MRIRFPYSGPLCCVINSKKSLPVILCSVLSEGTSSSAAPIHCGVRQTLTSVSSAQSQFKV